MNKWQIVTSVVVALAAVLSLAVVAFAQGPLPPASTPQGTERGRMGRWQQGQNPQAPMGFGFHFGVNGGTLVDITANVTGLSTSDVVTELESGKTFAQVAQAHGKTAADLVNAFVADRKAVLDKAVADGRLTQDVANDLLATMKANVEEHVNSAWSQIPFGGQPRGMGYRFNGQQPLGLGPRWSR
jgi:hypothetical protein